MTYYGLLFMPWAFFMPLFFFEMKNLVPLYPYVIKFPKENQGYNL